MFFYFFEWANAFYYYGLLSRFATFSILTFHFQLFKQNAQRQQE
jgi:hypothetical protein